MTDIAADDFSGGIVVVRRALGIMVLLGLIAFAAVADQSTQGRRGECRVFTIDISALDGPDCLK